MAGELIQNSGGVVGNYSSDYSGSYVSIRELSSTEGSAAHLSREMDRRASNFGYGLGRILGKFLGTVDETSDKPGVRGLQVRDRSPSTTNSNTATDTQTNTVTLTPTGTLTTTSTPSKYTTETPTISVTRTSTQTRTITRTPTQTRTVTRTPTQTRSVTSSRSPTTSDTSSISRSPIGSISPTSTSIPITLNCPDTDFTCQEIAGSDLYTEERLIPDIATFRIEDVDNLDSADPAFDNGFDGFGPIEGLNSSDFSMHRATNGNVFSGSFRFRDGLLEHGANISRDDNFSRVGSGILMDIGDFGYTFNVSDGSLKECYVPLWDKNNFRSASASASSSQAPSSASGRSDPLGTIVAAAATAIATGLTWLGFGGGSDSGENHETRTVEEGKGNSTKSHSTAKKHLGGKRGGRGERR